MNDKQQSPLAITEVKDPFDRPVPDGSATESTTLILSGTAPANTFVDIQNNLSSIVSNVPVTINGTWTSPVSVSVSSEIYSFTVAQTGGGGEVSSPWYVLVVRAGELPVPAVQGEVNGEFDPMSSLDGPVVLVRYPGMLPTDEIQLVWALKTGAVQDGSDRGSVIFRLAPEDTEWVVAANFVVAYRVTRDGTRRNSELLLLRGLPLPESVLSAAQITQASDDGTLDIRDIPDEQDLEISVPVWPLIKTGQALWLSVEGRLENGEEHKFNLPPYTLTSTQEPRVGMKVLQLRPLANNADFKLRLEVAFGQGRVRFPDQVYRLLNKADIASRRHQGAGVSYDENLLKVEHHFSLSVPLGKHKAGH